MKKLYCFYLTIILLTLSSQALQAQNLVPNPSFEDTLQCPTNNQANNPNLCVGWSMYGGTPDYFNECATGDYGVPSNKFGSQAAYNGKAYTGLITYANGDPSNYREFIGTRLSQPLSVGTKYYVSAFINRSDTTSCASNNFGFRFSMIPYSFSNPTPVNNFSHVRSNAIITDSVNWTRISGSFIADNAYSYLAIGNFYTNSNTSSFNCSPFNPFAYYYIDQVSVTTDSLLLPVTIVSFKAAPVNNKFIKLVWITDNEININNYVIERAIGGANNFISIGSVNAFQNSIVNNYQFIDRDIRPNVIYQYRLRIVENNRSSYSEIRMAKIIGNQFDVMIFPNPVRDFIDLKLVNLKGNATILITNNIGQIIGREKINPLNSHQIKINVSNLPSGTYYVNIQTDTGKLIRKILKI